MTGRTGRRATLAAVFVALLLAGAVAAWARYDRQEGRVARNLTLAGEEVGGMTRAELEQVAAQVASAYAASVVEVQAPGGGFSSDASELGLTVRVAPTVEATMSIDRSGAAVDRFLAWARSFLGSRSAPVMVSVDESSVHRVVAAKDTARTPPTEPSIKEVEGRLQAVEGIPGAGIDAVDVMEALPAAAARGLPIKVEVQRGSVAPRFGMDDAARLATEAEGQTAAGLPVKVGNKESTVPAEQLRAWLRSEPTDGGLRYFVDEQAATAGLRKLLPEPDPKPKEAAYAVVDGRITIAQGRPGLVCCTDAAGGVVAQAVGNRITERAVLPAREVQPKNVVLEDPLALGLKEQVATFTTNHQAGQPRVANIHLMADLLKGQVIKPGGTFSVNRFVGERTAAKGFVVDRVIEKGKYEESVGGGISQFATTLFNAGFFAGMEFPKYQSHSLYISRYPYGREATLSYPNPDLEIRNPSPYGVMIWPTYTGSSITVSLYSTKWVEVRQSGQTEEPRGQCKLVRTERTRTVAGDGTTMVDRVNALYRPAEGIDCTASPGASPPESPG